MFLGLSAQSWVPDSSYPTPNQSLSGMHSRQTRRCVAETEVAIGAAERCGRRGVGLRWLGATATVWFARGSVH